MLCLFVLLSLFLFEGLKAWKSYWFKGHISHLSVVPKNSFTAQWHISKKKLWAASPACQLLRCFSFQLQSIARFHSTLCETFKHSTAYPYSVLSNACQRAISLWCIVDRVGVWVKCTLLFVDLGECSVGWVGRGEAASLWQPLSHMMLDNLNRPTIFIITIIKLDMNLFLSF